MFFRSQETQSEYHIKSFGHLFNRFTLVMSLCQVWLSANFRKPTSHTHLHIPFQSRRIYIFLSVTKLHFILLSLSFSLSRRENVSFSVMRNSFLQPIAYCYFEQKQQTTPSKVVSRTCWRIQKASNWEAPRGTAEY